MNQRYAFFLLALFALLTGPVEIAFASDESLERVDLQRANQAARQETTSFFSNFLNFILRFISDGSTPAEPEYTVVFSVGAGGKVIDPNSGFECRSECAEWPGT